MRLLSHVLVVTLLVGATRASAQVLPPPPMWGLLQNDPNPLCGATRIDMSVPSSLK